MAVRVDTDAEGLELALSGFSTYPYTLMAWFRPVTLPNTSTELAMGLGGASANQFDALSFPSGTWQLQIRQNGGSAVAGSTLTTNVWYHLALVRSANTGTGVYLAYLNGVLDITGTSTWNQTNTFTRSFLGWGSAESTTRTVRGDYGIAKFYTAALSADEIYREVNSIRPTRLSDLYAWLPTFPGSGERNRDYSGNGRNFAENGTLSDTDHPPVSWGNKTWVIPWQVVSNEPIDNQPIYLKGSSSITDNQTIYLSGAAPTSIDNQNLYLRGQNSSSDNVSIYLKAQNSEYLVPNSDIVITNWKDQTGGTSNLYTVIDETTYNDSDYIYVIPSGYSYAEFGLSNPGGVVGSGSVSIRWRMYDATFSGLSLGVQLVQGSGIIASTNRIIPTSIREYSYTLSNEEVESITDWDDLRLKITVTGDGTFYTDGYGGNIQSYNDNLLNSSAPTFNLGAHNNFEYSPGQNCLLRFNISAIPSGMPCVGATLYLYKSYNLGDGGGTPVCNVYSIAEANKDWQAGISDLDLAEEDESCWNALAADGAGGIKTAWAGGSNGCGVSGTDYEATPIGTITIDDPELDGLGTEYAIELDTDRIASWFGTTNTNYGIIIKTTGGGDHWGQSDQETATLRPKLVVEYIENTPTITWLVVEIPETTGGTTSTDSQAIYLKGASTLSNNQVIYLTSIEIVIDNQPLYLKGLSTIVDNQSIYLSSYSTLTDTQNIYLESYAGLADTQSVFLQGKSTSIDNQSIFLQGKSTSTDNQSINTHGAYMPFEDDFTGADSSAWNSDKWIPNLSGGGTLTILGNEGRLYFSNIIDRTRATAAVERFKDHYLELDVHNPNTTSNLYVNLKFDQWHLTQGWAYGNNAVHINFSYSTTPTYVMQVREVLNSVPNNSTDIFIYPDTFEGTLRTWSYENKFYVAFTTATATYTGVLTLTTEAANLVGTVGLAVISSVASTWLIDNIYISKFSNSTKPIYLKGLSTLSDTQNIYLKSENTLVDTQNIYLKSESTLTDTQSIYLNSQDLTTDSQSIFLSGKDTSVDSQAIYLNAQDTSTDTQNIFLQAEDTLVDNQPIYTKGQDTLTDTQLIYLLAGTAVSDTQAIYLNTQGNISSDNQIIYLKGISTLLDNQSIYIQGREFSTDTQNIYLTGRDLSVDTQTIYLRSESTLVDNQVIYLRAESTITSTQIIYLKSESTLVDTQAIYLNATGTPVNSLPIYLRGLSTELNTKPIYLKGSINVTDNLSIFLSSVGNSIVDNLSIYLKGLDTYLNNQSIYLKGENTLVDNQSVYLKGISTLASNKPIYLSGSITVTNTQDIYLNAVGNVSLGNKGIYLKGLDNTLDNQIIYLRCSNTLTDTQSIFLTSIGIVLDNQSIYLKGLSTNSSTVSIYLMGSINEVSNKPIYLVGKDTELNNLNLYLLGKDTYSDTLNIYLRSELGLVDNQPLYIKGLDTLTDNISIYLTADITRGSLNIYLRALSPFTYKLITLIGRDDLVKNLYGKFDEVKTLIGKTSINKTLRGKVK